MRNIILGVLSLILGIGFGIYINHTFGFPWGLPFSFVGGIIGGHLTAKGVLK